jgi:NRPS condensation-like uncharacterized protein
VALDSIDEPMLIHAIVLLDGDVDPAKLTKAILSAQEAHPVMKTIVRTRLFRTYRQVCDTQEEVLTVHDLPDADETEREDCINEWLNRRLDPTRQLPVRVLLLKEGANATTLVFTFHHTATDGLRAVLFVRTIIESYNDSLSEEPPSLAKVRASRQGDELLAFAHSQRSRVERYYRKMLSSILQRFVVDFFRPPTRVFHDRSEHSKELSLVYETLDPQKLAQVESNARTAGVELNDLLLAACYRVVDNWNREHGRSINRVRIMAPVNISPKGFRSIVSNQASWLSITTAPEERADPEQLLKRVREHTVMAIRDRIPFSLVYFFYFCSRFPLFVMRWMCIFLMVTRTYVDTILITNLGLTWPQPGTDEAAITHIGSARIINATGSAPVVTPMGLSISVGIYNRHLNISLTYRPAMFSKEKAQSFLDMYVTEITQYPTHTGT